MNKKERNNKIFLVVGAIIYLIVLIIIAIISNMQDTSQTNIDKEKRFKIEDMIVLEENEKELLKEKTIEHIKSSLKTSTIIQFEEFEYICNEENIIKVKGYVDSQNSLKVMIRSKFVCEYFAIDNIIDTLVYLKIDDAEVLNIKDTYIEEYKKQKKLENIKSIGNELDQEKLDYIMNEFNNEELNDSARITNVVFNEDESTIEVRIIAKSSGINSISKNYWIDFNICSIIEHIKKFNIINKLKIKLVDKDKAVEVIFDDNFLKNEWKENNKIHLVKEIFGENYKEML